MTTEKPFYTMVMNNAKYCFYSVLIITFVIKLILAQFIPITGDEAEYVYWGQHLAWGYYEHPPLIGWLLHPISAVSTSNVWLRMPQILTTTIIAVAMYLSLRDRDRNKAYLIATLYLLTPVSLFDVGILTDTPLMLLVFFAVLSLFHAEKHNKIFYYLCAGLCMGGAYLSKYLMLPVLVGMAIFFLASNIKNRFGKIILFVLGFIPFLAQNIGWNYYHNWVNFLFNIQLRNNDISFSFRTLGFYLLILIYLYSPFVIYQAGNKIRQIISMWRQQPFAVVMFCALVPVLFYLLLSCVKNIGLHWIFCSYALIFIVLFPVLNSITIINLIRFMGIYTGIQLLIVVITLSVPWTLWEKTTYYPTLNWFFNYHELTPTLDPYLKQGFILMSESYAQSDLLAYRDKLSASVWNMGSVNGRYDDLVSDFKQFANKNILIVYLDKDKFNDASRYRPYFKRVETKQFLLGKMPYYIVLGYDFNYPLYREQILKSIYEEYYLNKKPPLLPPARDYFGEKYQFTKQ